MEQTILSLCLGVGLAAACGFRIFVPLLVMNLAARADYLELSGSFSWIASTPALIVLAAATVLEIGAYYIPWLDHVLDAAAAPIAVVAGVIAAASVFTGVDPMLKWALAVIAGGGAAGAVHGATSLVRGVSTVTTGGLGNFVVSTGEAVSAVLLSLATIVLGPLLALGLLAVALLLAVRWVRSRRTVAAATA
ncbi:MAG TPA: DUF4126 domain-containing protein [Thermoanaerobaculia bacterium]|nr:DUF4126 domain-containing protein [Thermoanaerobaculia bacterium]